ncbi:hypothetical protein [Burkholderia ubonensis]|uniref:hypothetical protein n=1 Tax=Burkholderia ubonensis TaxID=101571 RepID=UPI001161046D|nr:hypothetical protein [Burkholderia ubonensis]
MKRWAVGMLAAMVLLELPHSAIAQSIEVEPKSIEAGEVATLTWKTNNSTSAFITGVGLVAGTGTAKVQPARSTTYWLVVDGLRHPSFASTNLNVTGTREVTLWLPSEFPQGKRREVSGIGLVPFLDTALNVLLNSWGAPNPQWSHDPHMNFTTLYTEKFLVDERSSVDEPEVGVRRMAFSVKAIDPVGSALTYEISALVESRPRYESKYKETARDRALALALADRLDSQIKDALKGKAK